MLIAQSPLAPRKKWLRRFSFVALFCGIGLGIYGMIWFNATILRDLPTINPDDLQKMFLFSQSSIITDRNGKKLYKLFDENRAYVSFADFSPNLVNAAIATEDKTFWENDGLDYFGIMRAIIDNIKLKLGWADSAGGASTITQQLVRNILLTRDRSYIRKLKELVLTVKLYDALEIYVGKTMPNLTVDQKKRKQKEMIMELYLNYVFLGNNTYGGQIASQTYFRKNAKDLSVFEGALLAGIIQRPSFFDVYANRVGLSSARCPYTNKDNCMGAVGGLSIMSKGEPYTSLTGDYSAIVAVVDNYLSGLNLEDSTDNKTFLALMRGEKVFDLSISGTLYTVTYLWGRKDTVLSRMYAEKLISGSEFIDAVRESLSAQFFLPQIDIEAPHFVFWVKDYILSSPIFTGLGLDEDALTKGGYTITTTLDLNLQKEAEQIAQNHKKSALNKGATNRAFLYMDTKKGDVLAYLGSLNYFDEKIDGNVDIIRALRQPGSTMKSLAYGYGFQHFPMVIDTPIFDIPMKIGPNTPGNSDSKFVGLQPIREALAGSRNIPAIKNYFAIGEQQKLVPFLRSLGMQSISPTHDYGYSLALGAAELPMLELAQAYAHFSTLGEPGLINPILEIRDADGGIIYAKDEKPLPRVVQKGPAYLIRKILSEDANMPPGRAATLRVRGLPTATKSGTSNMRDDKNVSKARDGWLVTYTPSRLAIARVGNSNGDPMAPGAFGELNAPIMKDFFGHLLRNSLISSSETHRPVDVGTVSINKVTGLLATASTPSELVVSSVGYAKTLPSRADAPIQAIKIDSLCNGLVSDFTPEEEIKVGYVMTIQSFIPSGRDRNDILARLREGNVVGTGTKKSNVSYNLPNIFEKAPTTPCEERIPKIDEGIRVAIVSPAGEQIARNATITFVAMSPKSPIKKAFVYADDQQLGSIVFDKNTDDSLRASIVVKFPQEMKKGNIRLIVVNDRGYSNEVTQNVVLVDDTKAPTLDTVKIVADQDGYTVNLLFTDDFAGVDNGTIIFPGGKAQQFDGESVTFSVKTLDEVGYKVIDTSGNTSSGMLRLRDYAPESTPTPTTPSGPLENANPEAGPEADQSAVASGSSS